MGTQRAVSLDMRSSKFPDTDLGPYEGTSYLLLPNEVVVLPDVNRHTDFAPTFQIAI